MNAELLAPAGSYDAFKAALKAGCDAVYLGGSRFGARAFAENFSDSDLLNVIDEAHLFGKKVYLTINTLFKENELRDLYLFLLPLYKAGLDAVIIQDLGALKMVRECFPCMHIHASTQMTVTGYHGARFLEELGVSRVVPAREISFAEIRKINEKCNIEIECFVHGALCYCYSGQCLLSSFIGGRSGNRGTCAQPCRLPYSVFEKDRLLSSKNSAYPLNTKDICTVEILPEILKAGVYSLKIEGRMKRPEYTAGVVSVYRKYLDLYASGCDYKVDKNDLKFLFDLFNRDGFSKSYYEIHNGPSMMALVNKKAGDDAVRKTDAAYKRVEDGILSKELKIKVHAEANVNLQGISLNLQRGDVTVHGFSSETEAANNRALTEETLRKQLLKTGGTPYTLELDKTTIEPGVFMTVKALNDLRRGTFEAFQTEYLKKYRRDLSSADPSESTHAVPDEAFFDKKYAGGHDLDTGLCENHISLQIGTKEQLAAAVSLNEVTNIIIPSYYFGKYNDPDAVSQIQEHGKKAVIALPRVTFHADRKEYVRFLCETASKGCGFLVNSIEDLFLLRENGIHKDIRLESGFYMMNSLSKKLMESFGIYKDTVPLELNQKEISRRDNKNSEMIVYGRVPLMVSAQCIKKNYVKCTKTFDELTLKDRRNYSFPVQCDCQSCQNIIYNSVPISLIAKKKEVMELKPEGVRFIFTDESGKQVKDIYTSWIRGLCGEDFEYTRGHFTRGVK